MGTMSKPTTFTFCGVTLETFYNHLGRRFFRHNGTVFENLTLDEFGAGEQAAKLSYGGQVVEVWVDYKGNEFFEWMGIYVEDAREIMEIIDNYNFPKKATA